MVAVLPVRRSVARSVAAWAAAAPYASYGARQRWIRTVRDLTADWPVADGIPRWRQGEVTVRWEALAPRGPFA